MNFKRKSLMPTGCAALLIGALLVTMPARSNAADANDDQLSQQEQSLEKDAKDPKYETALKEKYNLTDDQLKALHDKGMNDSQITMAAALAKESGKSIDDIVKMRLDEKMGWGKIAKELGIPPKEIGQAIAAMHNHKEERADAKKDRVERRSERQEKRAERKSEREDRKSQRNKS